MSNLSTVKSIVSEIRREAETKIGEVLVERAAVINSIFDDAYGSCLSSHYASGLECAAQGLYWLDELIKYADNVMSTATESEWEYVRDALGSVNIEKAPLEQSIINEYKIRIKRYVSPIFGDHAKHYIIKERKGVTIETENPSSFTISEHTGNLIEATVDTLGATYYWDKELHRWVLDHSINLSIMPWLEKYVK